MSNLPKSPSDQSPPGFARRVAELRSMLLSESAAVLADRTGAVQVSTIGAVNEFQLVLFGSIVRGNCLNFEFLSASGVVLPEFQQLLLLYYFVTADGIALSGKWVSFADLPGGRMYARAFQGYSGDEIVKTFGEDLQAFRCACEQSNGQYEPGVGDVAFTFQVLPKVYARFVYWLGDEDFSSSCNILFDAAVTHYIPIDACAIIGSMLTRKIIKNAPV